MFGTVILFLSANIVEKSPRVKLFRVYLVAQKLPQMNRSITTLIELQKEFDTIDHFILLKKWELLVSQLILLIGSNHAFQIEILI